MTIEECIALLYRYAEYDGIGIPNLAGCKDAMKMAADLLSQPSLPSNLDEAARKYGREEPILPEGYNDGDIPLYERWTADAFKAGAEWMAEQGETVEGYITDEIAYNGIAVILDNEGQFKPGDKVIVQIRKKEDEK